MGMSQMSQHLATFKASDWICLILLLINTGNVHLAAQFILLHNQHQTNVCVQRQHCVRIHTMGLFPMVCAHLYTFSKVPGH